MKAKEIHKKLRANLDNKYVLANTYIYNWESDYFGVSKSGYAYEIEIKVSRSDFFADFKKERKHRMLQLAKNGKTYMTTKGHTTYMYDRKDWQGNINRVEGWGELPEETDRKTNINLVSTQVHFIKIMVPNRFYYAVPEGLIKKNEIPAYAGLIYVTETGIRKVKEAPFLTKQLYELNRILLDKFYHLSLDQRSKIYHLEHENHRLHRFEGELLEFSKEEKLQFEMSL